MNRKFLMIILIIFLIIGGGSYCLDYKRAC